MWPSIAAMRSMMYAGWGAMSSPMTCVGVDGDLAG